MSIIVEQWMDKLAIVEKFEKAEDCLLYTSDAADE